MGWRGDDRKERDKYRGDVFYEEWRSGLPEGSLSYDDIADGYFNRVPAEDLVAGEVRRQAVRRQERISEEEYYEQQRQEQEYPEEECPDEEST